MSDLVAEVPPSTEGSRVVTKYPSLWGVLTGTGKYEQTVVPVAKGEDPSKEEVVEPKRDIFADFVWYGMYSLLVLFLGGITVLTVFYFCQGIDDFGSSNAERYLVVFVKFLLITGSFAVNWFYPIVGFLMIPVLFACAFVGSPADFEAARNVILSLPKFRQKVTIGAPRQM